ncbi:MAG: hypothetical protein JNM93_10960, partial [Bacteriovoracaceae bacterium]|nr:hypothetical protein [Bacteriovoracaceae bacterium]
AFLRLLTLYPENDLGKELRTRMTYFYEVKKQMVLHSQEVAYLIKMHKKLTTAKEKMAFVNQSEKNEYLSYLKDPESFRNRLMMQVRKHEKLAKVFSEFPIYEGKKLIRNKPYEFFSKDKQEKNDVILSVLISSYNDELIPNLKFFQVNITSLALPFDSELYRPVDDFNHFVEVFLKRYQSRTIAQELALSDSDKDYFGLILDKQFKEAKKNKVLLDLFAYKEDVLEEVVDVLKQSVDKGNFKPEHFLDIKTILTHRIYKAYPLSDSQQAHLWSFLIEYQPEAINEIRLVLNEAHSKEWDSADFANVLSKDNDDFDKGREQEVLLSTWALWHNQDARNIKSLYQAIAQNSRLLSK